MDAGPNSLYEINSPELENYILKHPNSKYIIYTNNNFIHALFPYISKIPKDNIEEINVYEDGAYAGFFAHKNVYNEKARTDYVLHEYFRDSRKVFHISNADKLNTLGCIFDKECLGNKRFYKNDIVVKLSIDNLKQALNKNPEIKDKYFKILNFDYKKYKKEMVHPFGIFAFSLIVDNEYYLERSLNIMKEFLYGKLNYLVKNKNVKWYYKEHPSSGSYPLIGIMKSQYPDITPIDKSIPFELFLIADIVPDYFAGYSSGIFLNMPKNNISMFVYRIANIANPSDDRNLQIIKRYGIIRPGRCIFQDDLYSNSFKSKYNLFMSKILTKLF